jgi:hypothetical protein
MAKLEATKERIARPKFDAIITVFDSTMIKGVQYDHAKFVLDVQFQGGKIYRYANVTPLEFTQLITSRSTGKTFNAVIKDVKKFKLLRRTEMA